MAEISDERHKEIIQKAKEIAKRIINHEFEVSDSPENYCEFTLKHPLSDRYAFIAGIPLSFEEYKSLIGQKDNEFDELDMIIHFSLAFAHYENLKDEMEADRKIEEE